MSHMDFQPDDDTDGARADDARMECWFCPGVQSVALAPRHTGGDEDRPAHWVPVCDRHYEQWHNEVDAAERLPIIPRVGVVLSVEQAGTLTTHFDYLSQTNAWDEDFQEIAEAIDTGLRNAR